MPKLRCGHLFNGIGGFQLAAHWMGWDNVFHVEIDEFCNKVAAKNFPNSICYGDIKEQSFKGYRGAIELITGGFPCQPFSTAGSRRGTEDDRYLWPQMLRAIREVQPGYVVGENVRGITNWNGGMVFDQVQADLEAEGYDVLPFLLPAAGIGAPHRRDRIWFIAHADGDRFDTAKKISKIDSGRNGQRVDEGHEFESLAFGRTPPDPDSAGFQKRTEPQREGFSGSDETLQGCNAGSAYSAKDWDQFPSRSPVCRGDDGIPNRVDRIRGLGNAIVPGLALQIFKVIDKLCQI